MWTPVFYFLERMSMAALRSPHAEAFFSSTVSCGRHAQAYIILIYSARRTQSDNDLLCGRKMRDFQQVTIRTVSIVAWSAAHEAAALVHGCGSNEADITSGAAV